MFDRHNGNLIMKTVKFISKNYERDERTYIDKEGDEVVSSYGISLLTQKTLVLTAALS